MTITLAERERIIKKMDEQFESDLRMRKESNLCGQKAASTYKQLSLLQKVDFLSIKILTSLGNARYWKPCYGSQGPGSTKCSKYRYELRFIEIELTVFSEAILNRADMKMYD